MDDDKNRLGIIRISPQVLAELLLLPPGAEIVATGHDFGRDEIVVKVRCGDFRPVPEGTPIPIKRVQYRKVYPVGFDRVEFDGWGG